MHVYPVGPCGINPMHSKLEASVLPRASMPEHFFAFLFFASRTGRDESCASSRVKSRRSSHTTTTQQTISSPSLSLFLLLEIPLRFIVRHGGTARLFIQPDYTILSRIKPRYCICYYSSLLATN